MKKYKLKIKVEGEVIVTEDMYYDPVTLEQIEQIEEDNAKSDPTYFYDMENQKITIEAEEIREDFLTQEDME